MSKGRYVRSNRSREDKVRIGYKVSREDKGSRRDKGSRMDKVSKGNKGMIEDKVR